MTNLRIENLYTRFFDVTWNIARQSPQPVALIRFIDSVPPGILTTPVVFITNETLQQASPAQIDSMSINMANLLSALCGSNKIVLSKEVQIDCDWSASTKVKYFQLLRKIKAQPFLINKTLSATIRLHQLKFVSQTGIPPVDKGLLMCYNMGNLRRTETTNSILDIAELKKYVTGLADYPLPLGIAFPLFDWYILFHKQQYKGVIHGRQLRNKITLEKIK